MYPCVHSCNCECHGANPDGLRHSDDCCYECDQCGRMIPNDRREEWKHIEKCHGGHRE